MKFNRYACISVILMAVLILAVGCTSTQPSAPAPQAATPAPATQSAVPAASAAPVKTAQVDTTVSVHYGDYACLNVQDAIGKEYLYPDEKYRLSVSPASGGNVNVNVLFVDDHDNTAIQGVRPKWDAVQKKWIYEGIVPLVQFDDITTPVDKTFTIKSQSKYSVCVDDRKESGTSDVMLRVPVKLLRV